MVKTRSQAWVSRPLALAERMTLLWFLVDGITHLTLELSFLWFSCTRTSAGQEGSMLAFPWREYGKADVRWLPQAYDAGICSLEILTVWIVGPLCLWAAYAVARRLPERHILIAVICTAELYGGLMTFVPEWITGSPNLNTHNWIFTYIYLLWMNGVWVLIPGILLADSAIAIRNACAITKTESRDDSDVGDMWFKVIGGTVALYSVSVPAVLLYANVYDVK